MYTYGLSDCVPYYAQPLEHSLLMADAQRSFTELKFDNFPDYITLLLHFLCYF